MNDPFAYQSAHRRMAWLLRLSTATNVVLGLCLVGVSGALTVLMPLKEVRPALITLKGAEDQIIHIEPLEKGAAGFELLLEAMARRYVKNLLEIDDATQGPRFREAFAMTTQSYYKKFRDERIESKAIQEALDSGLTREILIESAAKVSENKGIYTYAVDFVQVDRRRGVEVERKPLRAYLAMTTAPSSVAAPQRYDNPLGIVVQDLTLKEKRPTP
ncbi:VirB8/TrbF family protein [Insolitispirillum peregrinum]|uniref:Type IV secretion system protein VirB8 n=1 Tax=Insolitispirillum peregrinum TaxID=80876 RepID=A0A1N7MHP7_9PROT|nr:VirB8/TrbF family protein [Insolitispirillum peregrinum]SIS85429.1 type IV secretion system protein VirB8 [Insolitispirillum peregrinum]